MPLLPRLKQNLPAIILFVFFLSLYIYTAAPTIYSGDSGEIAAAVNTLGLAHPTGFPLYMMIGKLFTLLLPIGDVAHHLNIFSALLTAISVALLFILLRSLGMGDISSILASIIFGFGRNTIWANAGTVNVYAISLFFTLILLNIFIKWKQNENKKYLYWYAIIFGLSLGGHVIMIVMGIPFLMMLWREVRIHRQFKILSGAIVLSLLPLSQYLYLWLAYTRNTVMTWGSVGSFRDFFNYITQRDYVNKIAARTLNSSVLFANTLVKFLISEFTIPFFIIILLGLFILARKNKHLFLLLISLVAANILIMFLYGNDNDLFILARYISIPYVVCAISLAYFFDTLFKLVSLKKKGGYILVLGVIFILIGLQLKTALAFNNRHNNFIINDFTENAFSSIDSDSIFITTGDPITGPAWYFQSINRRNDIIIISGDLVRYNWYIENLAKRYPDIINKKLLETQGVGNRLVEIFKDNISHRKIYSISNELKNENATAFEFVPIGLVNRIVLKDTDIREILTSSKEWQNYKLRNIKANFYKDAMVDNMTIYYIYALNNTGMAYFRNGFLDEGEYLLRKALDIGKDYRVESNLNQIIQQKLLIKH